MTCILLIDDDDALLLGLPELLRRQMRELELEVETSNSPYQGLRQIEANDYDAIISDISMPEMDGLTLLSQVKALRPEVPVLLMTARDDHATIIKALRGGAYDFIQKPIDIDYFVASLQRAIQVRALSRQVAAQNAALQRHAQDLEESVRQAVAEAEAAQRRLAFLAEVSTLLASSLDYEASLARLARLAVLYMADYCIVDVVTPAASPDEPASLRCVGTAHVNRNQEATLRQWRAYYDQPGQAGAFYPAMTVLQSGQAELYQDLREPAFDSNGQNAQQLALGRALNPHSLISVPIVVQEQTLGVLTLALSSSNRRYGPQDLALAEDLTRRAALAVRNAQLYSQAQEALEVRDQFLSVATHELKTPITSIMGMAQLLQRDFKRLGDANPRTGQRMEVLIDQTRRLNRLLDSLLNLSRLNAGQLNLEKENLDVAALTRRVTNELELTVTSHKLEYVGPTTPVIVQGDELRLEQVLQNLMHNSIKYSPNGGTIRVELRQERDLAWLSVADEGIGIASTAIPRLFDRYYRAENPLSQQIGGIGLGLYVVKEIVNLHGGQIEVVSQEGQGSVFTIQLPLVSAQ